MILWSRGERTDFFDQGLHDGIFSGKIGIWGHCRAFTYAESAKFDDIFQISVVYRRLPVRILEITWLGAQVCRSGAIASSFGPMACSAALIKECFGLGLRRDRRMLVVIAFAAAENQHDQQGNDSGDKGFHDEHPGINEFGN